MRAFLIFGLFMITACGAAPATTAASTPTTLTPPSMPTAAPTMQPSTRPQETAVANQVVAVLTQSGGIANQTDTFTIYSDGTVIAQTNARSVGKRPPAEPKTLHGEGGGDGVANLLKQIDATGVYELKSGRALSPCCDQTITKLTLWHEGQEHTYTIAKKADQPKATAQTLTLVEQYVAAAK